MVTFTVRPKINLMLAEHEKNRYGCKLGVGLLHAYVGGPFRVPQSWDLRDLCIETRMLRLVLRVYCKL